MSKIKLVLEVVSDLRSLADSIEGLVEVLHTNQTEPAEEPIKIKDTLAEKKDTPKASKVKETKETKENKPTLEDAPKGKQPTLEEVRALMADKNRDGHREAVKAILNTYGAQKLTALDPSHYKQVLKEVGDIK